MLYEVITPSACRSLSLLHATYPLRGLCALFFCPGPFPCYPFRYPFLSSQSTCGLVYFHITSAFSFWNSHGTTMTTSPSLIQVFFFIEPGILPIRTTPSMQRSLRRFAPRRLSTVARISLFSLRGVRTLVNVSSVLRNNFV